MDLNLTTASNISKGKKQYGDDTTEYYMRLGYIYFTMDCVLIIPIVLGNALILISIIRFRRLRTRMNILVGNLALSDFLIGVLFMPYHIAFLALPRLRDSRTTCLLGHSLRLSLLCASVFNLTLISLERFVAVIYPLKHNLSFKSDVIGGLVSLSWMISFTIGALPLLGWNTWEFGMPCDVALVFHCGYRATFFFCIVISIFFNFILYLKVVKTAWKQLERIEIENNRANVLFYKRQPFRKDYKKTKIRIVMLGVFAICWGPYIFYILFEALVLDSTEIVKTVERVLANLGLVSSSLNWIIFGAKNSDFRKTFKYLLTFGYNTRERDLSFNSSI